MGVAADVAVSDKLDRSTILALIAMGVAVLIVANDFTALSVALPAIEKQFDTDVTTVQWVINAYALTFGVLIIVGGRVSTDRLHDRARAHHRIGPSLRGAPRS